MFLFAGETVATLESASLELFKNYLNYSGLAHDVHDYLADVAGDVQSLPAQWMKEINPDGVFSIAAVKGLYARVRAEVASLERTLAAQTASMNTPLTERLWKESWRTIHHD